MSGSKRHVDSAVFSFWCYQQFESVLSCFQHIDCIIVSSTLYRLFQHSWFDQHNDKTRPEPAVMVFVCRSHCLLLQNKLCWYNILNNLVLPVKNNPNQYYHFSKTSFAGEVFLNCLADSNTNAVPKMTKGYDCDLQLRTSYHETIFS
jgi:hypothetical protein